MGGASRYFSKTRLSNRGGTLRTNQGKQGQAVKIGGLGTFTPTVRMDGSFDILFRPDPDMLRQLNDPTQFHAKILNKNNLGKSADDLVAQWNAEHPDDLEAE